MFNPNVVVRLELVNMAKKIMRTSINENFKNMRRTTMSERKQVLARSIKKASNIACNK